MRKITEIRVDFSLKREVFFVVIGAIVGAVTFVIPKAIFEVEMGLPYYLTWIAFGHVVGVYSSESVIAGIAIHMLTSQNDKAMKMEHRLKIMLRKWNI